MKIVIYSQNENLIDAKYNNDFIKIDISKTINIDDSKEKDYCKSYTEAYTNIIEEKKLDKLEFAINDIYYHNLKKIFSLINHISFLLKTEDIDEIVLVGGNKKFRYFPFYFAEAHEDGFQFLHKSSWYYNSLLYNTFKDRVKISFENEDNIVKLHIIKRVRQVVLLFGISLMVLIKHIKKWKKFLKQNNLNMQNRKNIILFPARTVHQLRFILPIITKLKEDDTCYPLIVFYEGLRAKEVDKFVAEQNLSKYTFVLYDTKTLKIVLKSIFTSVGNFFKSIFVKKEDLVLDIDNLRILIPLDEIQIESTIGVYYKVYYELLNNFVDKNKENILLLLSTEMTSKEAFLEKKVALNNNLEMYHFQTAMFEPKPMPIFPIGDKFFVNSKVNQKLLNDIGHISYGKVLYEGLFRYKIIKTEEKRYTQLKRILFATQPHDNQTTIEILEYLSNYLKEHKLPIEVFVKLHPRDNIKNYISLDNSYGLVFSDKQNIDLDKLIEESDLVVSRFSSMLQEALIIGTPYLACLFTKNDQSIKNDYLSDSLSVYSIEDLVSKINTYEEVIQLFNIFRKKYFKDNDIKSATILNFCNKGK